MNKRLGTGLSFKPGNRDKIELFLDEKMLLAPLSWKKPRTIFVCSMSDLFADFIKYEWQQEIFKVMRDCPQHTFQVLTKRPERMRGFISPCGEIEGVWPLKNVWLGVSCEDQETADARVPDLLATPAAGRFVSCQPLLSKIELGPYLSAHYASENSEYPKLGGLELVICGGESGPNARPMHPGWPRSLRDQCEAAGVPFFFKQWGEWLPHWQYGNSILTARPKIIHSWSDGMQAARIGKKAAGHRLDGVEHTKWPAGGIR
jgi:protein gp37